MRFLFCLFLSVFFQSVDAQNVPGLWHNAQRQLHYKPEGKDFVCVNPTRRFNRALYGTNTAFRVEAGDLPEFAMYLPGMGGNFKLGIINGTQSKWLTDATSIKAIYRPGSMLYEIKDVMLHGGSLHLSILALADAEGIIIKTEFFNTGKNVKLLWVFGGLSGKKFSRNGDIGADPESSFYLKPEYCEGNVFKIEKNIFQLTSVTEKKVAFHVTGIFPTASKVRIADANHQKSPLQLYQSGSSSEPVITGVLNASSSVRYFLIQNDSSLHKQYADLKNLFDKAEEARKKVADRVRLFTPDSYINTIGGALCIAGDAIWESPSYLHGAVAWRMRLPGWRGPYVADPLGWHDRAREHFSSYALSQLTSPATGPVVADTALHLARQLEKLGTSLFSSGYICRNPGGDFRPNHYDMNLVFIDALLNHFNWTSDIGFVRKMWPALKRHLAWEKRNFDSDGDGLYDSYADIWASDALQYSGGGVTHSSAYNYRANKTASEIASLIGENPEPYRKEAEHILNAIQTKLWMPENGWYAEYKDALGLRMLHSSAGLWTIYHAIDSKVPDEFQAWESLRYIDTHIPHIPVRAKGLADKNLYVLATTDWQPYTWSLNNVVLAENLNTSLAYWQGGRPEEAFRLWRSALIESMFLGASPGNFEQLSFYDAVRGELYRDFADPIGVAARTLVEGLFGIEPNCLLDTLSIRPGFPDEWNFASLSVPDISVDFKRKDNLDTYDIKPSFQKKMQLKFTVRARLDSVQLIAVNGKKVRWKQVDNSIGIPRIQIEVPAENRYRIEITWSGKKFQKPVLKDSFAIGESLNVHFQNEKIVAVCNPQHCLTEIKKGSQELNGVVSGEGSKTFFVRVKQGSFTFWQPISFYAKSHEVVKNNLPGITNESVFDTISLHRYFNAKVTDIFKQKYLQPRVKSPTLQLPTQGIGNWTAPLAIANIDDAGLRKKAVIGNRVSTSKGIPFNTPADSSKDNIVFTSQWNNFPDSMQTPLSGNASAIYLLMAGTTNPMQSRIVNGEVIVKYTDGSADILHLRNPQNWWPIEQDYIIDGYAFTTGADFPLRLYLKEGNFGCGLKKYSSIKGLTDMAIDGGAATVLNMPLHSGKELKSMTVKALANDVVIGLMSVTLQRK